MSYIVKQKIGNKYYAYEVESYWDKDKKQDREESIWVFGMRKKG